MATGRPTSLAVRLAVLAAGGSLVALVLAGAVMAALQRGGAERAFDERLAVFVTQLFADFANGDIFDATAHFANPAFGLPGSGWYWAVVDPQTDKLQFGSASLFDPLPPPAPDLTPGGPISRPLLLGDQRLRLVERLYELDDAPVLIRVTAPTEGLDREIANFRTALIITLGLMWVALIALALLQVFIGLRPLSAVQQAVADVRSARTDQVTGRFPSEVSPLVDELNGLLKANEAIVERARHHVGNLAHALKTPLAVIRNSAAEPPTEAAMDRIGSEAQAIEERIRLYLDRAQRAATQATSGKATNVREVVDPLVRTMAKLNVDKGHAFQVDIDPGLRVRADREDLEEMLGNLLENACRHAAGRVSVLAESNAANAAMLALHVDDDGEGLSPEKRTLVLGRGQRLDEAVPGSGLGLSIVKEMAELYGGAFVLGEAPDGGLRASLSLPQAAPVPPESSR
ncbi:MAG: HAMP domain-containing sensor histidine kinase [Pseudomonadota bacterium]